MSEAGGEPLAVETHLSWKPGGSGRESCFYSRHEWRDDRSPWLAFNQNLIRKVSRFYSLLQSGNNTLIWARVLKQLKTLEAGIYMSPSLLKTSFFQTTTLKQSHVSGLSVSTISSMVKHMFEQECGLFFPIITERRGKQRLWHVFALLSSASFSSGANNPAKDTPAASTSFTRWHALSTWVTSSEQSDVSWPLPLPNRTHVIC